MYHMHGMHGMYGMYGMCMCMCIYSKHGNNGMMYTLACSWDGGAFFVSGSSLLELRGGDVRGSTAGGRGGAALVNGGRVTLAEGCTVSSSASALEGGALPAADYG